MGASDAHLRGRALAEQPYWARARFCYRAPLPSLPLAACRARLGQPVAAWRSLEAALARGLLDDLTAARTQSLSPDERKRLDALNTTLEQLDRQITALLTSKEQKEADKARYRELAAQRQTATAELDRFASDRAAHEVYDLERIQALLPADTALIAWVDLKGSPKAAQPGGEHWAFVLRRSGPPVCEPLPGSGPGGSWTPEDDQLPQRLGAAFRSQAPNAEADKQALARKLYGQRLAPLEQHLRASANLPAVQRLIVVPAGWMNAIPVEALTDRYTVSYTPSGTVFARLQEERQQAGAKDRQATDYRLLAVGDPVFALPSTPSQPAPPPPDHGVLITLVTPDSNAAHGGLQPGDVVLRYAGAKLAAPADLGKAISQSSDQPSAGPARPEASVAVQVWRQGQVLDLNVRPGRLGIGYSQKAAADEIRARREGDAVVRGSRGKVFPRLPGTRREVEALARLFPQAETLLGSEASEQRLDELAASGRLRQFRVLHFATHGDINDQMALQSALILAQDRLPDPLLRATAGLKPYDGRLTAAQILKTWKLDADLVTLSACETGLGKSAGGEGYLGFSQVLFLAGARSLVLSLWSVQDNATALLMTRFYENLLGKRRALTSRYRRPRPCARRSIGCVPCRKTKWTGWLPG